MAIDLDEVKSRVWDNLIVGTGMGGSAIGYVLAEAGQSVLFCEKGPLLAPQDETLLRGAFAEGQFKNSTTAEDRDKIFLKAGRSFEPIVDHSGVRSKNLYPLLGQGVGGSTSLYGMVLERFFPDDFTPALFRSDNQESSAPPEWPIRFEDLLPYYQMAEQLLGVRGGEDFYKSGQKFCYHETMPPHPVNVQLMSVLRKKGLRPYLLPKGYSKTLDCETCQGYLCPKHCKSDARKTFIEPTLEMQDAHLLADAEVLKLSATTDRVQSVQIKQGNSVFEVRAKRFILGSGALNTAKLLLNSSSSTYPTGLANRSQMVGRNLMRHLIDLYSLRLSSELGATGSRKEVGINDFYRRGDVKLGNIQSFGQLPETSAILRDLVVKMKMNGHGISARLFAGIIPVLEPFVQRSLGGSSLLAGTLEDWPYLENRVFLDSQGRVSLHYRIHASEKKRLKFFRKTVLRELAELEPRILKLAHKNEMLGHACGTCRFGKDPMTSVLNSHNRAHDLENLFVVDSSFFPTSAGTNPALTIAANALRVGDAIIKGLA